MPNRFPIDLNGSWLASAHTAISTFLSVDTTADHLASLVVTLGDTCLHNSCTQKYTYVLFYLCSHFVYIVAFTQFFGTECTFMCWLIFLFLFVFILFILLHLLIYFYFTYSTLLQNYNYASGKLENVTYNYHT